RPAVRPPERGGPDAQAARASSGNRHNGVSLSVITRPLCACAPLPRTSGHCFANKGDCPFRLPPQHVLPDPNDAPTRRAQPRVGLAVLFHVAGELRRPVTHVAAGRPVALGATVPEATV